MSKDFSEYFQISQKSDSKISDIDLKELESIFEDKKYEVKPLQIFLGNTLTTTVLNFLTQPLQVIHTSYQLSLKKMNIEVNNIKEIMEAKINVSQQKKLEQILKFKPINYKAVSYNSYNQIMKGLAEQGILGFFKGFGSGTLFQIINSQTRYFLVSQYFNEQKYIQSLYTTAIALFVDIATNPLMLIQSRFILQNRLPNFRTYPTIFDLLKSEKNLFVGSTGHIYKHIALILTQTPGLLLQDQRLSLSYLLLIQQFVSYPFLTIIRRLQCQCQEPFMLKTNYKGFFNAFQQIYNSEGILRFYNGFTAFFIANTFISFVLYSTQLLGEAQD